MKFNWGTGIVLFLILFLSAAAVFIVFAMRQDVNLVHEDYYEKGVDYSQQMDVDARSQKFQEDIQARINKDFLLLEIEESLAAGIDSGKLLLFRPSDSRLDVIMPFTRINPLLEIPKTELFPGRYILKFSWYTGEIKYEVDKTINVH